MRKGLAELNEKHFSCLVSPINNLPQRGKTLVKERCRVGRLMMNVRAP